MRFTVSSDDGSEIELECSDTLASRWVNEAILKGNTYPALPFVEDVHVVVDVGANCGAFSVYFARRHPEATVHAIEPGSEPRTILERNAAAHPNVVVHPIGLHVEDQEVPLYRGDGDSILGSIFRREVNLDDCEVVTLRSGGAWAAEQRIDRIDVLKVDVEGCEAEVLRGLASLLPTVKVLYIEYDSRAARREIDDLLRETHELLFAALQFLDQGECIYLRRDLADHEEVRPLLKRWFESAMSPSGGVDGEEERGGPHPRAPTIAP